jgi:Tfp pilus assembly protein PilZ
MVRVMGEERRRSRRKRLLLDAKWESMSHTHEARVDDVSLGGCFVNTYGRVELGEQVNLQIQLPSGEWLPLRGQVASYQPGVGFGIAFTSLSQKNTEVLKELIATAKEREL